MSNKKDKKERASKPPLTEWQQRNLAFLKRQREREAEQRRKEQEARDAAKVALKSVATAPEDSPEPEQPKEVTHPLKARFPIKALLKALPVLILALMMMLGSGFLLTPYSTQKQIQVLGLVHADKTAIVKASHIKATDYIPSVWFNRQRYADNVVKGNDWVKSAHLTYQFPNRFEIRVEEYPIVAYTDTDDGYRPILENGKRPSSEPVYQLPDNYMAINLSDEEKVQSIISQLGEVKATIVSRIATIDPMTNAATKDLLVFGMKDGHQIRIPLSQISRKLPYYSRILSQLTEPSIIDMEVGIYTTTDYLEAILAQKRLENKAKASEEESLMASEDTASELE